MSHRAIDRFHPQPVSKPQTQSQGHPVTHVPLDTATGEAIEQPEIGEPPLVEHVPVSLLDAGNDAQPPSHAPTASSSPPDKPRKRTQPLSTRLRRQFAQGARLIGAPLVWVSLVAFCGGTGYAAFNWLSTIPPAPECDRLWFFSLDADKLFCAEQAARSGKAEALMAGLKLVEPWSANNQLYPRATRLKREWSKQLLQLASTKALQNDLNGAIELAEVIKPGNPVYREAKNAILEWQKLRDREHHLANLVEAALKSQDWKKAEAELQPPSSRISEYQRQQLNRLRERIVTERIAFNQLQQLQTLVKAQPANLETLGRAIRLASQINPHSYVSAEAQKALQQWSQVLAQATERKLVQGDIAGAIAAVQWLPAEASLSPALQELVWMRRAEQAANPATPLFNRDRVWQQTIALATLQQIQPNSSLYPLAQSRIPALKYQVQDLTQLTLADAVAKVPHIPALQLAIQMAQSITPTRPNRIAAQTLIAEWRKDIQRVEDRPYLTLARRLARSGKVKDLQTAIAHASKIPLGRALRPDAQAAVFDWRQQIQTIEDKPILDQALKLAQQKRLAEAIQKANAISAGRALHPEAQAAIQRWTRTIQTAEDQPILNEAKALANQGSLGTAIAVAYQIAPGRALYEAAQKEIATWSAQLAATRPTRRWERDSWDGRNGDRDRDPSPPYYDTPRWRPEPPPAALPPEPPPPPDLPPP